MTASDRVPVLVAALAEGGMDTKHPANLIGRRVIVSLLPPADAEDQNPVDLYGSISGIAHSGENFYLVVTGIHAEAVQIGFDSTAKQWEIMEGAENTPLTEFVLLP